MLFPLFLFLHTHVLIPCLAKRPSRYEEIQHLNLTTELSDNLDHISPVECPGDALWCVFPAVLLIVADLLKVFLVVL